jgi:hypothetical protein
VSWFSANGFEEMCTVPSGRNNEMSSNEAIEAESLNLSEQFIPKHPARLLEYASEAIRLFPHRC